MAVGPMEVSLILAVLFVPLGLFWLLWRYLKREAPGGDVPLAKAEPVVQVNSPVSGAKTCKRCGFNVKAFHGVECPNCGSLLAT